MTLTGGEEEVVAGIARDILSKLPANFDVEKVQMRFPVAYEQSLNQVGGPCPAFANTD